VRALCVVENGMLARETRRILGILGASVVVPAVSAHLVLARTPPWRIAQGSDGML
jgi:hypothetical protein